MADIPLIDLTKGDSTTASRLLGAARSHGFIFVRSTPGTGLDKQTIQSMFDLSKAFFSSPYDVKDAIAIGSKSSGENRGWLGMHGEVLDPGKQKKGDFKEAFNFSPNDPPQPLAGPLATERDQILAFQQACHKLCQAILRLFAVALDISPDWFESRHDLAKGDTGSILRLLYYPSLKRLENKSGGEWQDFDNGEDVRAGAHSDYGSITLLFQQRGQPGLEISPEEGRWESVPVDPVGDGSELPILVNIGDLLSYWTNGLLKSTVHRVIFPKAAPDDTGEDRYSIAYFCHPLHAAQLVPVPSQVVQENSGSEEAKAQVLKVKALGGDREVLTARDHLNARLRATYVI